MSQEISDKVKAQFGKTARNYVTSSIHAKGDDLKVMLELAGNVKDKKVLDVATGGGHTALTFARVGAEVTAVDLTPEMLAAAEANIREQGFTDVIFREANAEALPFEAVSFDIVTCRIAPHHFAHPQMFVQEVARVLKPGGYFLLIDNIAPLNSELATTMNHIEKVRDPSHVEAYSLKTWTDWLSEVGLELHHLSRFYRDKDFDAWLGYAEAEGVGGELESYVLSLPVSFKSYLKVVEENGHLEALSHEVALILAKKPLA